MNRVWIIDVVYNGAANQLELASHQIVRQPGDHVVWRFIDIPRGFKPGLLLESEAGGLAQPFGPFTSAQVSANAVKASGHSGEQGVFPYRAEIVRVDARPADDAPSPGERITSERVYLAITDLAPPADQGIDVTLQLRPGSHIASLVVRPAYLPITEGETVVWTFRVNTELFFPQRWQPVIHFVQRPRGEAEAKVSPLGPFSEMTVAVPFTSGQPVQVIGSGASGYRGVFDYWVEIRTPGRLQAISSGDPTIDNDGQPVIPPGLVAPD